jgi:ATP-dependent Lon protease
MKNCLQQKEIKLKLSLFPKDNEIDLKEMQQKVKEGLKIIPVNTIMEAIPYIFPQIKIAPAAKKKAAPAKTKKRK